MAGQQTKRPRARAEETGAAARPQMNDNESPLASLLRRRDKDGRPLITQAEFDAGERLRADFFYAHLSQKVTASWSGIAVEAGAKRGVPGFGVELGDGVVAARERVRLALKAAGPELSGVLIDVCCYLKGMETLERESGWPARCGRIVLQLALARLARHYGLVRDCLPATDAPVRVRHWGASDYRPGITGE